MSENLKKRLYNTLVDKKLEGYVGIILDVLTSGEIEVQADEELPLYRKCRDLQEADILKVIKTVPRDVSMKPSAASPLIREGPPHILFLRYTFTDEGRTLAEELNSERAEMPYLKV